MGIARSAIRTKARALADQDDATFPTDTQYNDWLDDGARTVFGELVAAGWPVDYSSASISGAATVDIADCCSVQAVYKLEGTRYVEVPRLDPSDKAGALSLTGQQYPCGYEIRQSVTQGTVVRFFPAVAGSYVVEYVPEIGAFANDAAQWYGPEDSYRAIALLAAADGTRKEGRLQDSQALRAEYRELMDRIIARASWVDQRNPAKIRDVMQSRRDPFAFDALGPGSNW